MKLKKKRNKPLRINDITIIDDSKLKKAITAAALGNAMEWFDFGVYGFLAYVLGQVFFPGEYSATKIAAPEYSPPIEKPWASFANNSKTGAHIPMVSYPGIRPIAKVLSAIIMMVTDKTFCRPNLSPNIPNTTPPNGLTRNGTENVASAAIICTPGDAPGKNT